MNKELTMKSDDKKKSINCKVYFDWSSSLQSPLQGNIVKNPLKALFQKSPYYVFKNKTKKDWDRGSWSLFIFFKSCFQIKINVLYCFTVLKNLRKRVLCGLGLGIRRFIALFLLTRVCEKGKTLLYQIKQ